MEAKHGEQRNHKTVTEVFAPVEAQTTDGHKFLMPTGSHTYTQSERFCKNCGWVTCKGIIGALLCSGCNEGW